MQRRVRSFVAEYNRRTGATVLLTSHYMADVVALCRRVIVIHHGRILFDGDLSTLTDRFAAYKTIGITLEDGPLDANTLAAYGEVIVRDGAKVMLRVARGEAPRIAARLLAAHAITDLTIEDPPIDDVIERVFTEKAP